MMYTTVSLQACFYLIGEIHTRIMGDKTTERVLLIGDCDSTLRIAKQKRTLSCRNTCDIQPLGCKMDLKRERT